MLAIIPDVDASRTPEARRNERLRSIRRERRNSMRSDRCL
jgi:hypothetical protein